MSEHRPVPSAASAGDDSSTAQQSDAATGSVSADSLEAIRADIVSTRAELADTVDQVVMKLDVKARASDRVASLRQTAGEKVSAVRQGAPSPLRECLEKSVVAAGPSARRTATALAPYRGQIAFGATFSLLALVIVRHRRRVAATGARTS